MKNVPKIFLLILSLTLFAVVSQIKLTEATHLPTSSINSCSALATSGDTYILTGDISNSTSSACMQVRADNITLDCQGRKIDGVDVGNTIGVELDDQAGLNWPDNFTIKNCTITDWGKGIYIENSTGDTISSNTISSNTYGISTSGMTGSTIKDNVIKNNSGEGLNLVAFSSNTIYNNEFNNTQNVVLSGTPSNTWSTALSKAKNVEGRQYTGGNYWATPPKTGFSETCADQDSDEVCDASFTVASNNIDSLPLAKPNNTGYWLNGFPYRRAIEIKNTLAQPLTDYKAKIGVEAGNTSYQLPITISSVGTVLSNYQIKITVNSSVIIGHIKSDGSDIRFFTNQVVDPYTATLGKLPYWIEKITSSQLIVWVKVDTIPASGGKIIYMHYGNPTANAESSGVNTFIRYMIDHLVGAWHFNGNMQDESGNNLNGSTINSNLVFPTGGKFNSAYRFNNAGIDIPDSSVYKGQEWTWMAWINIDNCNPHPAQGEPIIIGMGKWNSPTGSRYMGLRSDCLLMGDLISSSSPNTFYSGQYLPTNFWIHVAFTYDGATMRLYSLYDPVNGQRDTQQRNAIDGGAPYRMAIGKRFVGNEGTNTGTFAGSIDEVLVFSRALTPDEISDIQDNYTDFTTNVPRTAFVRKHTVDQNLNGATEPSASIGSEIAPKISSNCSGLRFTDSDGFTKIGYWLGNNCVTNPTPASIKVPKIDASGKRTVYMYSGNLNASSESDYANALNESLNSSIIGLWHFDAEDHDNPAVGKTRDMSSLSNNHGTRVDNVVVNSGKFGNAYNFPPYSSHHIEVADNTGLRPTSFTIMAWIRPTQVTSGFDHYVIASKVTGSPPINRGWSFFTVDNKRVELLICTSQGGCAGACCGTSTTLTIGQWTHVAATYDFSTSSARIYFNGSLVSSGSFSGQLAPGGGPFAIGRRIDSGEWFVGDIDEVVFFNKALSSDEVTEIYNTYNNTALSEPSKVAITGVGGTKIIPTFGSESQIKTIIRSPQYINNQWIWSWIWSGAPASVDFVKSGNAINWQWVPFGSPSQGSGYPATISPFSGSAKNWNWLKREKKIFVTGTATFGSLGEFSGADNTCQNLANSTGLIGTYKALLSTSTFNAKDRISNCNLVNTKDDKISNDCVDLWDGSLENAVIYNSYGEDPSASGVTADVWSGTIQNGRTMGSGSNCDNWTSDSNSAFGASGDRTLTGSGWINKQTAVCNSPKMFYCFQD